MLEFGIGAGILAVRTIGEPGNGTGTKHVEPFATIGAEQVSGIKITLPDGTSVKVGDDVGLAALRRVMTVLRR